MFIYSSELMHALSWTLLHSVWQAFIIAILLLSIIRFGKNLSAHAKYIWAIGSLITLFVTSAITFYIYLELPIIGKAFVTSEPADWSNSINLVLHQEISTATIISDFVSQNSRLISLSWLIGLLFFILRTLFGIFQIQRLKQGMSSLPKFWNDKLERLKNKAGYTNAILLGESQKISSPLTFGFLKPALLFPIGMINQLSIEQVEAIMAHELAHIIRRDYLVNLIQTFIESIYYFNPSVWVISTIIRNQREHCCDDLAIELTGSSIHYVKALVAIEESKSSPNSILAMSLAKNKKTLLNRVKRILNQPQKNENMKEKLLMCMMLFISVIFISMQVNPAERTIKSTDSNQDTLSNNLFEGDTENPSQWVEDFAKGFDKLNCSTDPITSNLPIISLSETGNYLYKETPLNEEDISNMMKKLEGDQIILAPHYNTEIEDIVYFMELSIRHRVDVIFSDVHTAYTYKFREAIDQLKALSNTEPQVGISNINILKNENGSLNADLDELTLSWDIQDDKIQNIKADIIPFAMDYNTIHHFNDSVSFYIPKPDPTRVHPKLKSPSSAADTVLDYPGLHILDFDNLTITRSDEGLYWTNTDENTSEDDFLTDELYAIMLLQNEQGKALRRDLKDTTWNKALRNEVIQRRINIQKNIAQIKSQERKLNTFQRDTLSQEYANFIEGIKDSLALRFLIGKSTLDLDYENKLKIKADLIREYSNEMRKLAQDLKSEMEMEIEEAKEYQNLFEYKIKIELEEKMKDLHFELQEFLGDYNLGSRDKREGDKTEGGFDELSMITISISDLVAQKLLEDGLIKNVKKFTLEIEDGKMIVDKQVQSNHTYQKWAKLISRWWKDKINSNSKIDEVNSNSKILIKRKNNKDQVIIQFID